jgi:hypothetical protein
MADPIRLPHEPLEQQALAGELVPQLPDGGDLPHHRRPQDILTDIEHDIETIRLAEYAAFAACMFLKASR